MNHKKQLLFAATDGIADEYLAEAAATRLIVSTHAIKRIAAIAAMIALLFTFLFWMPTKNATPTFAVRVFAAENSEQTVAIGNPPVSMNNIYTSTMYEHLFSDIWEHDAFCFKICRQYSFWKPQNYDTDVVIEYSGKTLSGKQQQDSSFRFYYADENLAVFPIDYEKRPQDSYLCIHGWLEETTDLTIHLYITQDNSRRLVQTITVRVNVDEGSWTGYTLEVTEITMHQH